MSLRGVSDEAIAWYGQEIASQSLAMTCSGKWGRYSGYDPKRTAGKKITVLIVDDQPENIHVLVNIIQERYYYFL